MNLEQQVCSPDLANQLKKLGMKQESLFYWIEAKAFEKPWLIIRDGHHKEYFFDESDENEIGRLEFVASRAEYFSAFTVAELGEMLPSFVKSERDGYINLRQRKTDIGLYLCSGYSGAELVVEFGDGTNEANSRAKMLIYLIENKLITI